MAKPAGEEGATRGRLVGGERRPSSCRAVAAAGVARPSASISASRLLAVAAIASSAGRWFLCSRLSVCLPMFAPSPRAGLRLICPDHSGRPGPCWYVAESPVPRQLRSGPCAPADYGTGYPTGYASVPYLGSRRPRRVGQEKTTQPGAPPAAVIGASKLRLPLAAIRP